MGKGNTSETCGHIISTQGERTDIDPVMSERERAELLGRMIADQERSDAAAETLERDIDKGRILEGRNVLALISTIYREVRDLRRSIINGSRPIDPSAVHLVASMPLDYTDNLNNRHRDDAICLYEVCKATETNRNSLRSKDEEELIKIHMKKRLQPYIDSGLIPESIIIEAHTVKPSYDDRLPVLPYGSVIFRANVYPQQIDEGVKEEAVSDAVLRRIGEHAIRSDAPQHSTAGSEKLTPENDEVILRPDDLAILHWCSRIAEFARIVRQDALDNRQNEDGIYPSVAVQEREIFINQNSDDKNPTVPSRFPRRPLLRYDFVSQVTGDYIVDFIRDDLLHRLQPHIDSGLIPPVAVNVELCRHKAESYVVARVSFDALSKEWGKKLQERDVANSALDVPISRSS